eukprot:GHVU01212772.1.p2 GENE.GHVU01212772.1~~GHVU01212772.1.p2  ORF type:complete len:129 (-),score=21.58 GHVU01212772.1:3537-3923(-)
MTLFGETSMMRYRRLCRFEVSGDEEGMVSGGQMFFRNAFEGRKRKKHMEEEDDDLEGEEPEERNGEGATQHAVQAGRDRQQAGGDADSGSDSDSDCEKQGRKRRYARTFPNPWYRQELFARCIRHIEN